jgi:hypothetical protein
MDDDPCQFLSSWILWICAGTVDYIRGHGEILQTIFENLPREIHHLKKKYSWAIARGNLIKGLHTMIWGKPDEAEFFLTRAIGMGSNIDEAAMKMLIDELLNYEAS